MTLGVKNEKTSVNHVSSLSTSREAGLRPSLLKTSNHLSEPTPPPLSLSEVQPSRTIAMLGLRRCGKSSIHHVMFHKMSPNEAFFSNEMLKGRTMRDTIPYNLSHGGGHDLMGLINEKWDPSVRETTTGLLQGSITNVAPFLNYEVWDISSNLLEAIDIYRRGRVSVEQNHLALVALDNLLRHIAVVIFVMDFQDDFSEALSKLHTLFVRSFKINPSLQMHVFIHKTDGLLPEMRMEVQQDIEQRLLEELSDMELDETFLPSFHLTSIYDGSIYEAFSRVIQKLLPKVDVLENSLNALCAKSALEKAFLFDASSKVYIATDTSPVEVTHYQLCSNMIDTILDISAIYG
jgi:hypothetical protein